MRPNGGADGAGGLPNNVGGSANGGGGGVGGGFGGSGGAGGPLGGTGGASAGGSGGGEIEPVCDPGLTQSCYEGPNGTVGIGVCAAGVRTCSSDGAEWGPCEGDVIPGTETCNDTLDNNCNGEVNEGGTGCVCQPNASKDCYSGPAGKGGVGICKLGTSTCNAVGTAWGACTGDIQPAASETCGNGADDDCDGTPDTDCQCDPTDTQSCYSGPADTKDEGICHGGTLTCGSDSKWGACADEVTPQLENCSTPQDEDCDGLTSNDAAAGCLCVPGVTTSSCYTGPGGTAGIGTCKAGTKTCDGTGKAWGSCVGEVTPEAEVCGDGLDNDCDGTVGSGWTTETVPHGGSVGSYPSLKVHASTGDVWVAYRHNTAEELWVAKKPMGGSWTKSKVDNTGTTGRHNSLGIDASGGVWVSHHDSANALLRVAHKPENSGWNSSNAGYPVGGHTSLAIAPDGGIWVSYFSASNLDSYLKVVNRPTSGSWQTAEVVDAEDAIGATWLGRYSSLGIDESSGDIWVSYNDGVGDDLKVARKPFDLGWEMPSTIVSDGETGIFTSLGVDGDGGVWVSFVDDTNNVVNVVHKPFGQPWEQQTTVGSTVNTGDRYTSLSVAGDGGVWVSFYNQSHHLSVAHKPAGEPWELPIEADSTGDVGSHSSLDIDESGGVWVGYYDTTNSALKVAYACP